MEYGGDIMIEKQIKETIQKRIETLEKKREERRNEPFHINPAFNNPMSREYDKEDITEIRTLEWVLNLFDGDVE